MKFRNENRHIQLLFSGILSLVFLALLMSCGSTKSPAINDKTTVMEEADTARVHEMVKQEQESSIQIMQEQMTTLESNVHQLEQQNSVLKQQLDRMQRKMDSLNAEQPQSTQSTGAGYVQRYEKALADFYDGEYATASREFQDLLNTDRSNDYADNAQYWMGECYYSVGDYQKALHEFQKVLEYNGANKLPDAQFKIALTYLNMGEPENARDAFRSLKRNYPDSRLIPAVNRHLEELQ